jgi:hypothetical protein
LKINNDKRKINYDNRNINEHKRKSPKNIEIEPLQRNRDQKQLKEGQKEHYSRERDNRGGVIMTGVWDTRLRPRTRPEFPGNTNKKHKGEMNPSKGKSR